MVDQLVEMAKKISIDPAKISKVSHSILAKLERCITLRQYYLDLFDNKMVKETEELEDLERENKQHAYFVQILKKVLSILKPKGSSSKAQRRRKAVPQGKPISTGYPSVFHNLNSFGLLNIDDGESEDEENISTTFTMPTDPPTQQSAASPIASSVKNSVNDQQVPEDYLFAVFCLFNDLHRLLRNALQHWKLYKNREISLETATVIHNTSIAAMRQTERGFIEAFQDRHSTTPGYWEIAVGFYNRFARHRGSGTSMFSGREDFVNKAQREDFYKVEMKDVSELMCLRGARLVITAASALDSLRKLFADTLDQNHNVDIRTSVKDSDLCHFVHLVLEITNLRNSRDHLLQDDFSYGIQELHSEKPPPIGVWLVFATELFLDTNSILGDDVSRAFDELKSAAHHAHETLSCLNAYSMRGSSLLEDPMYFIKIQEHMRIIKDHMLERTIFYHHPALFGTLLLWLRLHMHILGSSVGRTNCCFLHAAHAYNTFREFGGLDVCWPEMEKFIGYHTPEKIFAGRTPKTLQESLKRSVT